MSINECISSGHPECDQPIFKYIPYMCGNTDLCRALQIDEKAKGHERWKKAAEAAKRNVIKSYFVIGILEQFEDTLTLFENAKIHHWNQYDLENRRLVKSERLVSTSFPANF